MIHDLLLTRSEHQQHYLYDGSDFICANILDVVYPHRDRGYRVVLRLSDKPGPKLIPLIREDNWVSVGEDQYFTHRAFILWWDENFPGKQTIYGGWIR